MSEGQENIAPISRIPQLPKSPAGKPSGIPSLSSLAVTTTAGLGLGAKRKLPSSPVIPAAKRTVSGTSSASGLSASTTTVPTRPLGLRSSQRKVSGNGGSGFVPTTTRKVSATLGSAATTRNVSGINSRPGSRIVSSASTSSTTTRSTSGVRSTRQAPIRRPPVTAATRSTSTLGKSNGSGTSRGVSPGINLGRGVSPGLGPGGGPKSAIGTGVASAAQFKSHDGRIENVEKMVGGFKELLEREQAKINGLQMSQADLQSLLVSTQNTEREARRDLGHASEELAAVRAAHAREIDDLERSIARKDREKRQLEDEVKDSRDELSRERETVRNLKQALAEQSTQHMTLSAQLTASQTQGTLLQAEIERATLAVSSMKAELEVGRQTMRDAESLAAQKVREAEEERDSRIAEIEEELRTAETIRRRLHNQVQELKGNIRVFARVRPQLPHESESPDGLALISYGDERKAAETGQSEMTITSRTESATGKEREQVNSFLFDKVFEPTSGQSAVFEEISMLAQSVLDGYNVCIFAYGQTGSGKSWTMEGGDSDETVGMIPRAIDMIFKVSGHLKDRGWKYHMEGQFLEVYNEVINDLLGSGQFDTKKHEIKSDKDGKLMVTDVVSIPLSNPRQVQALLERARSRRAVAATLMNERSSRSHSVFTLKVRGVNPLTDEKCEAMLNLVDLAGSERLASSGAGENKDRLKETININKSLSALADVIGALGQGIQGGHVPYRNSTLTRLLQPSLSGSSKTLMLCNISPLAAHLGETLCSLRFATKVNSTQVGSAKKQVTK